MCSTPLSRSCCILKQAKDSEYQRVHIFMFSTFKHSIMPLYSPTDPMAIRYMDTWPIRTAQIYENAENMIVRTQHILIRILYRQKRPPVLLYLHLAECWDKRWSFGHWKGPVVVEETVFQNSPVTVTRSHCQLIHGVVRVNDNTGFVICQQLLNCWT